VRKPSGELDREKIINHVGALMDESVDTVAISTAHGHTAGVGEMVRMVRSAFPSITIIAGNVTSASGVAYLADCGADAIKVGQGPGSICTTRMVAGVGIRNSPRCMPQAKARPRKTSASSPTAASPNQVISSKP
jgi:IMP dehydrogenase